jgi:pimeloyl-ACP methyl ester carboxylesterase
VTQPSELKTTPLAARSGGGRSLFVAARDGLRLHVREYSNRIARGLAVVCLPGLTRTTTDFNALGPALAESGHAARVIAIDSRGRGQSEWDSNPANYNLAVELDDVMSVLTALGIARAVFVGSSRGGILTMLLAAAQPTAIAGAVLHDVGPVIEPEGVARIKSYVGKLPQPKTTTEGAGVLRDLFGAQFPTLTAEHWVAAAQRTWRIDNGELVLTYDVKLAQTLADFDVEHPLPPLWKEFDALAPVPVLVIRGAFSDILSEASVNAMRARHPGLDYTEIPAQGHVPLLEGEELLRGIAGFVAKCGRTMDKH